MKPESELLAANAAYYEAFVRRNHQAMAALWAEDGVSCIHPGWPALIGRDAVLASYGQIFLNPHQQPIRYRMEGLLLAEGEARVFCVETVGETALVATNWFRQIKKLWRLQHHQASPLVVASQARAPTPTKH